ncbi:MAG TPA: DUF4129 domain-containing protein [Acidimicrobiia bacterium]|nr:DUF4129 domain-containing protein [Acidimicrobiia bacterium]
MKALTLALMAGLAGSAVAEVSLVVRPWVVALPAAVVAFTTAAHRVRRGGSSLRVPLLAIPIGVIVLQGVSGGRLGVETALAALTGLATWGLVGATVGDVEGVERGLPATEGMAPIQRLRVRFVAVGVTASACAAVGAVAPGGMLDLGREAVRSWSAAPLAYFAVGLGALGATARVAERRRWQRDGATIDGGVDRRWAVSLTATVVVLVLAAAAVERLPTGITAIPSRLVAASGSLGDWIVDRAAAPEAAPGGSAESGQETATPPIPAIDERSPAPPWVGDLALIVLFALVLGFAIVRGRTRRALVRGASSPGWGAGGVLRSVAEELVALIRAVWSGLRRLFARRRSAGPGSGPESTSPAPPVGWAPRDPVRRRIAAAYRRALSLLVPAHVPLVGPETPRELALRVDDLRFSALTRLYEEARFSDHVLGEGHASEAETTADRLDSRSGGPFGPGRGSSAE